jgi:ribosomal protein S17
MIIGLIYVHKYMKTCKVVLITYETCMFNQYILKIYHVTSKMKVLDDENINLKLT